MARKVSGNIDTSQKLTIKKSNLKTGRLIFVCLAAVAFGIWLIRGGLAEVLEEIRVVFGWICVVFFGVFSVGGFWRLIFADKTTLILSPSGLRDTRASTTTIPWSALTGISKWKSHGIPYVILEMRPEEVEKLKLTPYLRVLFSVNRKIYGKDCLSIAPGDLDISFSELQKTIKAYAYAHNPALRDDA